MSCNNCPSSIMIYPINLEIIYRSLCCFLLLSLLLAKTWFIQQFFPFSYSSCLFSITLTTLHWGSKKINWQINDKLINHDRSIDLFWLASLFGGENRFKLNSLNNCDHTSAIPRLKLATMNYENSTILTTNENLYI